MICESGVTQSGKSPSSAKIIFLHTSSPWLFIRYLDFTRSAPIYDTNPFSFSQLPLHFRTKYFPSQSLPWAQPSTSISSPHLTPPLLIVIPFSPTKNHISTMASAHASTEPPETLHKQKMKSSEIVITEQIDLHLLYHWNQNLYQAVSGMEWSPLPPGPISYCNLFLAQLHAPNKARDRL